MLAASTEYKDEATNPQHNSVSLNIKSTNNFFTTQSIHPIWTETPSGCKDRNLGIT